MKTDETRAACRCRECNGKRKLIALAIIAQNEEEQGQLEAINEAIKAGQQLHTAKDFQFAIERADWDLDYVHFCRLLSLHEKEDNQHSLEMWRAFHALVQSVGRFDVNNLTKLIEYGLSLQKPAEGGQLVISMQ